MKNKEDALFIIQEKDGIRYGNVTGVQTCALPISARDRGAAFRRARAAGRGGTGLGDAQARAQGPGGEPRGGTMTVRAVLIGALSLPRRLVAVPVRAYQVGMSQIGRADV